MAVVSNVFVHYFALELSMFIPSLEIPLISLKC